MMVSANIPNSPIDSIRIFSRYREYDSPAAAFLYTFNHPLKNPLAPLTHRGLPQLEEVRSFKIYYLNAIYTTEQLENIAVHLLCDPVIEGYSLNGFRMDHPHPNEFDFMVEIAYLPGVVDNEGRTFHSALEDYLKDDFLSETHTASGCIYLLRFKSLNPDITPFKVKQLFTSLMVNPLIERIEVSPLNSDDSRRDEVGGGWDRCRSLFKNFFEEFHPGEMEYSGKPYEVIPLTHLKSEAELMELSQSRLLYLSPEEMRAVIAHYLDPQVKKQRLSLNLPLEPTDAELEVIAQTWSEHCKHKIFAARIAYHENGVLKNTIDSLYQTYIKKITSEIQKTNPRLLSVFSDNSGVFRFTEDTAICMKVETHNSPSALDPFGGAITGIVGVNRDILGTGLGAQPLFNTDVFCFGYPDYSGPLPPKLFHPLRVMQGVHHGVERGGNESGIPTVNGAMIFDDRFMGKPLVFCGTGGILPTRLKSPQGEPVNTVQKEIHPGDLIVMVGGRVGKDGIHGATFSSVGLDDNQPSSVVQIGDPIVQKKMTDFLLVARDRLLYRTLTDNGAGGLSSSVGEMALLSRGCRLELENVLLKYPSLKPWEILVSESQERMTLALPPENRSALESLAREYDVEICFIGEFSDDGFFLASYRGELLAHLSLDFLHHGLPQMFLEADWVKPVHHEPSPDQIISGKNYGELLKSLLSRPNIASKESWVRRYDHEVKALTILKPFDGISRDAPMDAAVVKPLRNSHNFLNSFDSYKGLVISNGLCPRLSDIDSYAMAAVAVDEAVRNVVAAGGNPQEMYALDNFCWPDPISSPDNPDGKYKLAQLVRANQALGDVCRSYGLPLISGKDSMKNDYGQGKNKISVPPTLLVTVLSVIPDYRNICSSHFKRIGSPVYLLGEIDGRMGGSELYSSQGMIGNDAPQVKADENYKMYQGLYHAIQEGWVVAAHDISDGGLGVTLAESCFGFRGGLEVDLHLIATGEGSQTALEPWQKLFSEPAGCLVVEVLPEREEDFLKQVNRFTARFHLIGKTISDPRLIVRDKQDSRQVLILNEEVEQLKKVWQSALAFD